MEEDTADRRLRGRMDLQSRSWIWEVTDEQMMEEWLDKWVPQRVGGWRARTQPPVTTSKRLRVLPRWDGLA